MSSYSEDLHSAALAYHRLPQPGKLEIQAIKPLANQRDLALAYSPGVAAACTAIAQNPAEAATTYAPFAAGKVPIDDLVALAKYHTHHHHPVGDDLKKELALYADELKLVGIFKPSMNTAKYAERIYADVLS